METEPDGAESLKSGRRSRFVSAFSKSVCGDCAAVSTVLDLLGEDRVSGELRLLQSDFAYSRSGLVSCRCLSSPSPCSNLFLGFALAVYLGAAPRFSSFLRGGHKETVAAHSANHVVLAEEKSGPLS